MASTLLAVDDSATMRKIFEITFSGTDLTVVTADSTDAAMTALGGGGFDLALVDAGEAGSGPLTDGYALCKRIKDASPSTRVVLLSSKQHPYNTAAGQQAGADDHVDKPFDTTQLIGRVQGLLSAGAAAPAPAHAPAHAPAPATTHTPTQAHAPAPTQAPTRPAPPVMPQRAQTLVYVPGSAASAFSPRPTPSPFPAVAATPAPTRNAPAAPAPTPAPAPAAAAPIPAPAPSRPRPVAATTTPSMRAPTVAARAPAAAQPPATPAPSPVAAKVNGQLAGKLDGLGLTPAQTEAVLALSREVVERVVWEVVPVLAETIIKEEIARLTK